MYPSDESMYVCLCNAISDKTLREVVRRYQPKSIQQLRQFVPVGKQCGKCIRAAREIMDEEMQHAPLYKEIAWQRLLREYPQYLSRFFDFFLTASTL